MMQELNKFITELHLLKSMTQSSNSLFNVLHITHRGGGGTEFFIQNLISQLRHNKVNSYVFRPSSTGNISISCDGLLFPHLQSIDFLEIEKLIQVIEVLNIEYVHVHNFFGYSEKIIDSVVSLLECSKVKLVVSIHDYYGFCPSLNLRLNEDTICSDYNIEKCKNCKGFKTWEGDYSSQSGRQRVESFQRLLDQASNVWVPNITVKNVITKFFPGIKIKIQPHDERYLKDLLFEPLEITNAEMKTINIAVLGYINFPKGRLLLERLARYINQNKLPILINIIGSTDSFENLLKYGVKITGGYESESEALKLLEIIKPDVIYIPSIWPETYCYTLSLALFSGIPVVVNNLGAQGNRLSLERGRGFVIEKSVYSDPAKLADFFMHFDKKVVKSYTPVATNCLSYYNH